MSRNNVLAIAVTSALLTASDQMPVHPVHEVYRLIELQQSALGKLYADAIQQAGRSYEARKKAAAEALRPKRVRPAEGVLTSGFGARWGSMHQGIDIANAIGTPILSAADGVVIEAGPARGFGLWVRVRHDDGTITVYGHVDRFSVTPGTRVLAGDELAKMGNRGQSTGPHLHFEVWQGGRKVNPLGWLP